MGTAYLPIADVTTALLYYLTTYNILDLLLATINYTRRIMCCVAVFFIIDLTFNFFSPAALVYRMDEDFD